MSAVAPSSALPRTPALLIAAAGTGGHVMPGLAVADALRARGWSTAWLGTQAGMERTLVERAGLPFHAVAFSSVRGKGLRKLLLGPLHLAKAVRDSVRILRRTAPQVVFTTGGYIAVPAGLAAAWTRRPLVFLNADAAPQLSLRILLRFVRVVLCGFDGAAARLAGAKARVSGTPVREEVAAVPDPASRFAAGPRQTEPLTMLVMGGSLGARVFNETVPQALAGLAPDRRPRVWHQCGAGNEASTRAAYAAAGVAAEVWPFLDDVADRYARADVVLCRAGAVTVSELCAAGVASVLVPFVASTTAHQRDNAEFLAAHGAAIHLPQAGFDAQALARLLGGLQRDELERMARQARALGRPDATKTVADEIERLGRPPLPRAGEGGGEGIKS